MKRYGRDMYFDDNIAVGRTTGLVRGKHVWCMVQGVKEKIRWLKINRSKEKKENTDVQILPLSYLQFVFYF